MDGLICARCGAEIHYQSRSGHVGHGRELGSSAALRIALEAHSHDDRRAQYTKDMSGHGACFYFFVRLHDTVFPDPNIQLAHNPGAQLFIGLPEW